MEQLDLWGNINDDTQNSAEILTLLEQQASLLTNKTNGKVTATFERIKYRYVSSDESRLLGMYKLIGSMSSAFVGEKREKEEILENEDLENAASLYNEYKYKFEISSSKYRYRIFTLCYTPVFPVSFEVEYGILEDKVKIIEINSLEDAQDELFKIFNSRKVKYIIQEMLKSSGENDDKV